MIAIDNTIKISELENQVKAISGTKKTTRTCFKRNKNKK